MSTLRINNVLYAFTQPLADLREIRMSKYEIVAVFRDGMDAWCEVLQPVTEKVDTVQELIEHGNRQARDGMKMKFAKVAADYEQTAAFKKLLDAKDGEMITVDHTDDNPIMEIIKRRRTKAYWDAELSRALAILSIWEEAVGEKDWPTRHALHEAHRKLAVDPAQWKNYVHQYSPVTKEEVAKAYANCPRMEDVANRSDLRCQTAMDWNRSDCTCDGCKMTRGELPGYITLVPRGDGDFNMPADKINDAGGTIVVHMADAD